MSEPYHSTIDGFGRTALDEPRLYDGVRSRRIGSFLVDYTLVLALSVPGAIVVAFLSVLTLGLGLALYGVLIPLIAIVYVAFTLGGAAQATPGMRLCGLRLERLDGGRVEPVFAVLHGVLFWTFNAVLTPAVLLVSLFNGRKQLLHDLLLGTVIVRRR